MKKFLFFGSLIILSGCEKTEPDSVDLCPTCTSLIELNGEAWPSDLRYALFQTPPGNDTFFRLEFQETNPVHDQFEDAVLFWHIPYHEGEHRLDSLSTELWGSYASLFVFEGGYESPDQFYETFPDSTSYFNVDFLDKTTGRFQMTFEIYLHPEGIPGSPAGNSTFPNLIEFKGSASGIIEYEG